MGVKGLWRLLLPIGRRISIETLEGKILAIDASIWLTQFLKAMRDPETGSVKAAAHLIGFFRRLAKLRFHGIRPVLVFDGETPEIKRREVQQRRKRREQFALTGQAAVQRMAKRLLLEQLKKTKQAESGGAFAPGFHQAEEDKPRIVMEVEATKISGAPDDSHDAILAEVADLEDEWKEQPNTENDWDTQIIEDNSDGDEKQQSSSIYNHTYDVFNVDRISSLPSHSRKDAVEEAKRQQRMRSRREFMPVAGKPQEYSQAQLRNFLRSSRLNQEISKMAKKAAGNDENGIGERMASDATRRIIFTKDSDEPRSSFKRLQKRVVQSRKLPAEEDDDEEFEWEDGEAAVSAADAAIELVDSDDESFAQDTGGFMSAKKMMAATKSVIRIDNHSSDEDIESGFIAPGKVTNNVPHSKSVFAVDSDIDEEEGGGFLPAASVDMRKAQHDDAGRAQEMESEILARALQESESDPSNDIANKEVHNPVQQSLGCSKETMLQIDSDVALAMQLQEAESSDQNDVIEISSRTNNDSIINDEESDEVDWEDGDQYLEERQEQDRSVARLLHSADETAHLENLVDVAKHSQARHGDEASDDEIVWKSDDEKVEAASRTLQNRRNAVNKEAHVVSQKPNGGHNAMHATQSPTKKKRQVTFMEGNDFDVAEVTDGNAMALEHAQATAANLTNWAGRAFRRAIAQHAQQTGSSENTSHSNKKEKKLIKDSIESNFEAQDTAPSFKQTARPSVQYPFVTDESNRDRSVPSERANFNESAPLDGLLEGGAASFQEQADILNAEARRQERDMDTVTDEMKAEIIQLIQLFGIPYVESPAEAEAQCVKLEELGLVDGIVTEDSDVFVFGGKSIYRNIFDDQKYVEAYLAKDAERELALGRNQMVALAMLLGCDYSEGVKGVGIVNGVEVLQAFDVSDGVKEGLTKFRKWLDGFDPDDARKQKAESGEYLSAEQKFSAKHKSARTQWNAPTNFPADNVINAFLKPVVDSSSDRFSWGTPDLEKLLVFCQRNMGWEQGETRKLLEPVLQRLEDSSRQTRLESFFMKYDDNIKFANVKSKRLREVFQNTRQQSSSDNESPKKRATTKS